MVTRSPSVLVLETDITSDNVRHMDPLELQPLPLNYRPPSPDGSSYTRIATNATFIALLGNKFIFFYLLGYCLLTIVGFSDFCRLMSISFRQVAIENRKVGVAIKGLNRRPRYPGYGDWRRARISPHRGLAETTRVNRIN
ncbi:hypothetical protein LZ30DRAFT_694130 [Colletotrichum cereale]|nr:hypothetical protein LZ30DRAFT_694130 [Colletotrichum cereale]